MEWNILFGNFAFWYKKNRNLHHIWLWHLQLSRNGERIYIGKKRESQSPMRKRLDIDPEPLKGDSLFLIIECLSLFFPPLILSTLKFLFFVLKNIIGKKVEVSLWLFDISEKNMVFIFLWESFGTPPTEWALQWN